jgi:hypothetical protein
LSAFEYIVGFHTIVLGLATARLLETLAGTVKHRTTVRHFWVHTVWVVILQLTIIGWWYALWRDLRGEYVDELGYLEFLFTLSISISWFVAAALLDPDLEDHRDTDLEAHFFSVRVPLFLTFAWPAAVGFVGLFVVGDEMTLDRIATSVEFAVLPVAGLLLRSRRGHEVLVLLHGAAFLLIEISQQGIGG